MQSTRALTDSVVLPRVYNIILQPAWIFVRRFISGASQKGFLASRHSQCRAPAHLRPYLSPLLEFCRSVHISQ